MKNRPLPHLSENIKKARAGRTLAEVGELMHKLDPDTAAASWKTRVWQWENQKVSPTAWQLTIFAAAVDVHPGDLFSAEDSTTELHELSETLGAAVRCLSVGPDDVQELAAELRAVHNRVKTVLLKHYGGGPAHNDRTRNATGGGK